MQKKIFLGGKFYFFKKKLRTSASNYKNKKLHISSSYAKIFTHGSFPEVGQKQKTERKREKKREEKKRKKRKKEEKEFCVSL